MMEYQALIDSLHRDAEKRIRLIWKGAETEAAAIKEDMAKRSERLREEFARREGLEIGRGSGERIGEANAQVRLIRLWAENAVCERLRAVALSSLPILREGGYGDVFGQLVAELPALPWKTVKVNPDDVPVAQRHFPGLEVVPDDSIAGGFEIMTEAGKMQVTNTFQRRLERAWPDIMPDMLKAISNGPRVR